MDDIGIPVKWTKIDESSWYKVETSKKYTYYYNKSTKESSWEEPKLEGGEDLNEEDLNNYRELIKNLNLSNETQYEQALPKLLYDQRFQKIPKSQRKRLFNNIRRDLVREKSKSVNIAEITEGKEVIEVDNKEQTKRVVQEKRYDREKRHKKDQYDASKRKFDHVKELAHTNFMNLLHEKVKMPFQNGEGIPKLPVDLVNCDARFNSQYLSDDDKENIYQKFKREFLTARIELFKSKLNALDHTHLKLSLNEIVELVGARLFRDLPESDLNRKLSERLEEIKQELFESFKLLLQETIGFKTSSADDLVEIKEALKDDDRYKRLGDYPKERDELILKHIRGKG